MTSRTRLSVIVPVFNEERTVGEILRRVLAVPVDLEIVIVDDASTDGTADVLKSCGADVIFNTYEDLSRLLGLPASDSL